MFFALYMLIGSVAGILGGLLGIGGGIILIPALAWIFSKQGISYDLIMHIAAGTSLSSIIFIALSSAYGHAKRGSKIWSVYKKMVLGIIIGTIFGAIFGHFLPNRILEILFGIFVLFFSVRMIINIKQKPSRRLPNPFLLFLISFIIGTKSGILGIGGGAIIIPFLIYCNIPIRNVVAISASCSVTIAIIGCISYIIIGHYAINLPRLSVGYVYLPAFLGIIITAPIFAQIGAYLSHKLQVETLKKILGAILLLIAIKMLI